MNYGLYYLNYGQLADQFRDAFQEPIIGIRSIYSLFSTCDTINEAMSARDMLNFILRSPKDTLISPEGAVSFGAMNLTTVHCRPEFTTSEIICLIHLFA